MKKYFILFVTALAGLTVLSCQKENNRKDPEADTPVIHFTAIAEGTKTVVDASGDFANWSATDELTIAEVIPATREGSTDTTFVLTGSAVAHNLSAPSKSASFDATLTKNLPTGATAKSYSYVAVYPNSSNNLKVGGKAPNDFYRVNMPADQWPGVGTFDSNADVLISAPVDKGSTRVATGDEMSFRFRRIGTAVKMTVHGLTAGEKLKSITLTAPVDIVGYVKVDLSTGNYLDDNGDGEVEKTPYSNNSKTVTLKFNNLTLDNNPLDVWFRVLPCEWNGTLEIIAETDVARYYRTTKKSSAIDLSANPMVFADGGRTTFAVNLGSGREVKGDVTEFTKVTSQDEIGEGARYIIANLASETAATVVAPYDGTNGYTGIKADVEVLGGSISIEEADVQMFTLERAANANEFYVLCGGKYLSCTASNATLSLHDSKPGTGYDIWTVTTDGIANTTAKKDTTPYSILFNASSNPKRFANYASAMGPITLFKNGDVDTRTLVKLSFANATEHYTTLNYNSFTGQVASANPNETAITGNIEYALTGDAIGTVDASTGAVTLNGSEGTATVTASFAGDTTYQPASASYTISVTNGSELSLTFPFDSSVSGWPAASTASAAGSYTYALGGVDYTFTHTKSGNGIYCASSYLMICSGNYLGLPAVDGFKLVSVSAQLNDGGNPSTASEGTITSDTSGTVVTGGETQVFDTKGDSKTFTLTGTEENTVYYLAISNKNFQCTEIVLEYEMVSTLPSPGMSWSAASASASLEDGNVVSGFTAPVLTAGNATGITYESTNTSVATVDGNGTVSVVGPGETTIKAIFAGDSNYKPQTVSYTLTVSDNRTAVETPTFSQAAGEVPSGTVINLSCATAGATIYYTTGSSAFSAGDWTQGTSVTINASVTVKAIAVKAGMKDSAVATAAYSIPTTIADVIAGGGSGSFVVPNVTVFAVPATHTAIIGDATGKVLFYKASHGLAVGDVITVSGSTTLYNGVVEFTSTPTATKTGTTTVNHGSAEVATSELLTPLATSPSAIKFITGSGTQSGQDITAAGKVLHLPAANAATDGKAVVFTGYIYGWSSSYSNFNFVATALDVDPSVASLEVDQTSLNWAADATDSKTVTVTLNGNGTGYSISPTSDANWNISDNGSGTITVSPKEANTSTSDAKTLTITITHNDDPNVHTAVTCTQAAAGGSTATPTLQYTLDGNSAGTGNAYASANPISQNNIDWIVYGNTQMTPWRLGGKGITNQDRAIYSTKAISANISQINVVSGTTGSSLTVNSLTISVHNSAADAASGSNAIASKSVTTGITGATVTLNKTDNTSWAGKYYRIVYNVTRTGTSGNGYVQFSSATFYGVQ